MINVYHLSWQNKKYVKLKCVLKVNAQKQITVQNVPSCFRNGIYQSCCTGLCVGGWIVCLMCTIRKTTFIHYLCSNNLLYNIVL
jgi:hypothetical protein